MLSLGQARIFEDVGSATVPELCPSFQLGRRLQQLGPQI